MKYPVSVNKCETGIKTDLLMQMRHLNVLICSFELFCGTVVSRDSCPSSSPLKSNSCVISQTNLLNIKTQFLHMKLDLLNASVFLMLQHVQIVLNS